MVNNMNNLNMSGDAPNTTDDKISFEITRQGHDQRLRVVNHASDNQTEFDGHVGNDTVASALASVNDFLRQAESNMGTGETYVLTIQRVEAAQTGEEEPFGPGYTPPSKTTANVDGDQGKSKARTYSERDEETDQDNDRKPKRQTKAGEVNDTPDSQSDSGLQIAMQESLAAIEKAAQDAQDATNKIQEAAQDAQDAVEDIHYYLNQQKTEVFDKDGNPVGTLIFHS